jgi:hypothetical protein
MPTYYGSTNYRCCPNVLITHQEFCVEFPYPQLYRIRDLRDVGVSTTDPRWTGTRGRHVVWELTATYHDRPVTLFRCADERTFGQVKRALVRALEVQRR